MDDVVSCQAAVVRKNARGGESGKHLAPTHPPIPLRIEKPPVLDRAERVIVALGIIFAQRSGDKTGRHEADRAHTRAKTRHLLTINKCGAQTLQHMLSFGLGEAFMCCRQLRLCTKRRCDQGRLSPRLQWPGCRELALAGTELDDTWSCRHCAPRRNWLQHCGVFPAL